jgi:RNA polymerase-associated protein RTF1
VLTIQGGWVRYLVGQDEKDQPQYRICEIQSECQQLERECFVLFELDLGVNLTKPYKINDITVNQTLELKHGKSLKAFHMDKVSNAPFTQVCFLLPLAFTFTLS